MREIEQIHQLTILIDLFAVTGSLIDQLIVLIDT